MKLFNQFNSCPLNNGEIILKLIKENLIKSAHDVSSGGLILTLAEMSMNKDIGIILEKPKQIKNLFEFFYGEDQGRYVIEVAKSDIDKVNKYLKDANIFSEIVGTTQKEYFELAGELKISLNDLYKINNKWYTERNGKVVHDPREVVWED